MDRTWSFLCIHRTSHVPTCKKKQVFFSFLLARSTESVVCHQKFYHLPLECFCLLPPLEFWDVWLHEVGNYWMHFCMWFRNFNWIGGWGSIWITEESVIVDKKMKLSTALVVIHMAVTSTTSMTQQSRVESRSRGRQKSC